MGSKIFREQALNKISSPEELNSLIKVTSFNSWFFLFIIIAIILSCVVWSFYGAISDKVDGSGILLTSGSITKVVSPSSGMLVALNATPGQVIMKNQIIANISQREVENKIKLLEDKINLLKSQTDSSQNITDKETTEEISYVDKQSEIIKKNLDYLNGQYEWLKTRVKKATELAGSGAISKIDLNNTQKELFNIEQEIYNNKLKLEDFEYKKTLAENKLKKDEMSNEYKIKEATNAMDDLLFELNSKSSIGSPSQGTVLEVSAVENQSINQGDTILTLLNNTKMNDIQSIVYFSPIDGKKIKKGMRALVAPLNVQTSKYGYIQGIVKSVNNYPSSSDGMLNTLKNADLVKQLSAGGAPIKVIISLIPSASTYSGFKWTSSNGPNIEITDGTICSANIVVNKQRPISFVIPFFNKYLLGEK